MCAIRIWKATSTPSRPSLLFVANQDEARESGLRFLDGARFTGNIPAGVFSSKGNDATSALDAVLSCKNHAAFQT